MTRLEGGDRAAGEGEPAWVELLRLISGTWATQLLYAAVELGLPQALAEGPLAAEQVAARTGCQPAVTHRLLRALAGLGVLEQRGDGRFALDRMGQLLCAGRPQALARFVQMMGSPWHHQAWQGLIQAARGGGSGAQHAFGTELWGYLQAHPAEGGVFHAAMTEISDTVGATAVDACDFSGVRQLVDVGGGQGRLLCRVLARHPGMRGVVFDRPALAEGAEALLRQQGMLDRCRFVGGDFFRAVPEGGDAYLVSHVLHNWSDAEAVAILRRCREAMQPGGKLRLLEVVVGPPGERDWGKVMDLEMLAMFGGRQRTAEELGRLLGEAGFVLERVIGTVSPTSAVEASAL